MSFKEDIKIQLSINLQSKQQQKAVVDALQVEIQRCIALDNIPVFCSVDYDEGWNDEKVNMLKMLIKCNIGVDCDVGNGRIWCQLINFL